MAIPACMGAYLNMLCKRILISQQQSMILA